MTDASEGGLLVYLLEKIDIGNLLKIEIFFAKDTELTMIEAIARVVWSDLAAKRSWGSTDMGCSFYPFLKEILIS